MKTKTKEKLKEVFECAIENEELAGGSLLVRSGGEEIYYLEAGMADREKGISIARDHIYRLYSMSKPVTGAAALKLFEDGLLELGEPVSAYIPAFRGQMVEEDGRLVPPVRDMTVQDLLNMTSGLLYADTSCMAGNYVSQIYREVDERLFGENPMTTMEFAEKLGQGPLAFQPGSTFRYGTSADVLGAVIEAVSGMTFGEYLDKYFFDPLGMKDTGFYVPTEKINRLVKVYTKNEDGHLVPYEENHLGIQNIMGRKPAFESGGAGLVSTVDDYARFAQMMLNGGELDGERILSPVTVKYMTSGGLTEEQEKGFARNFTGMPGYTYGNQVRVMKYPGRSCTINNEGEYGWDGWLGCYFANDPVEETTVLFMMQRTDAGLTPLIRRLRNVLMCDF